MASQGDVQQLDNRILVANVSNLVHQNDDNPVHQNDDNDEESLEDEVRLLELEGVDPGALLEATLVEDATDKLDSIREIFLKRNFKCNQQDLILHWLREDFQSHRFPLSQKTLFKTARVPIVPVVMNPGKYFHFSITKGLKTFVNLCSIEKSNIN